MFFTRKQAKQKRGQPTRWRRDQGHRKSTAAQKSLIWIDDRPLKQQAYKAVEKTIKMIEKGELAIERYLKEDQSLYEEWVNLTFRKARESVSELRDRLRAIRRFHNWIVATVRQSDVDPSEAYQLMKDEEQRYEKGSEAERAKIEEIRRQREAYIDQEIAREFDRSERKDAEEEGAWNEDEFGDGDESRGDEGGQDGSHSHHAGLRPPRDADEERVFQHFSAMSEKKIAKVCRNIEDARALFFQALSVIVMPAEMALLLRIWQQCSPRIQKQLKADFRRVTGADLSGLLAEAQEVLDEIREDETMGTSDERAGESDFDFRYSGHSGARQAGGRDDPEYAEKLKIAFRRLVRHLHPDTAADARTGEATEWQKRLWHRAQQANKAGNLKEIEVIYTLTLLRQKAFADLSLSEIQGSQAYLEGELEGLREQTKQYRRSPAWGFSRKRTYTVVERKIQKEIDKERDWLSNEIEELELLHRFFASDVYRPRRRTSRRRTTQRRRRNTRTRRQEGRHRDSGQMPLF